MSGFFSALTGATTGATASSTATNDKKKIVEEEKKEENNDDVDETNKNTTTATTAGTTTSSLFNSYFNKISKKMAIWGMMKITYIFRQFDHFIFYNFFYFLSMIISIFIINTIPRVFIVFWFLV